jgi:phage terminase large subunit
MISTADKLYLLTEYGRLSTTLFPQQQQFIFDKSKMKAACCTRRAGKSHVAAIKLLQCAARIPNSTALYLALTQRYAKVIMWRKLKQICTQYKLKVEFKESELICLLPNNSRIVLYGADKENLMDTLLGDAYCTVVIDEAQSFGTHLQDMIDEVLEPATLDFDGDIALIGTPGPTCNGIFYDAAVGSADYYSRHKWSLMDNYHLHNAKTWLEDLKQRRQWTEDNATYRRQYLGEWVIDLSALVYKFNVNKNLYHELPEVHFNYIIGLDYGWNDATAFCVLAYSEKWPHAYIVDCYGRSSMTPSMIAVELEKLMKKYSPERIIADTGGLGKSITEEMRLRYGLPIQAAEKTEKMTAIDMINCDFVDSRLFVNAKLKNLHMQYEALTWDDKHKEDPGLPNDLCDCCLYAHRFSRHYWGQIPTKQTPIEQLEQEILDYASAKNHNEYDDPFNLFPT